MTLFTKEKINGGIFMKEDDEVNNNFLNLVKIVEKLRDKENGCLWCNSQTSESIAKYSTEEANEVIEAIKRRAVGKALQINEQFSVEADYSL